MMDERQRIKQAIAAQENLRTIVGDEIVEETISMLREKLAQLETPEQQRKLVTILFTDIVGSTEIVKHLDPEDAMEIMDGALKRLALPVQKHGGHVTRFMGDGFKAVFGMPKAHENDPEMAIRAGLGILETVQEQSTELEQEHSITNFQVRVGINTGLVVIGGLTEAEDTIMGSAVNLAARLESAAPPGGLMISHNTYRHVRGIFNIQLHEPIKAKGFDEPIQVYLVEGVKPRAFRMQTRGVEGVETRMVGREEELRALQEAYRNAIDGEQTQVITVVGDAGVGKSRLLYEFQNWLELLPDEVCFFQGRSSQEAQNLPYALLKDVFTFRFHIQESDTTREVRSKIEAGFGEVFGPDNEGQMRAHIIGQLLGFDFSDSPNLKDMLEDPQQLRDRTSMCLGEYFQDVCEQSPTVIFLEDIHWADNSSLDMIISLSRRKPEERLLMVCLARSRLFDRRPDWVEGFINHTQLALESLSQQESFRLVQEILKLAEPVPDTLRELVVNNAEGNPFYVEELIKMLIEDGVIITGEECWRIELGRFAEIKVPATLTNVLQARLDNLPQVERETLQQASVVGRTFWDDAVEYISTNSTPSDAQFVRNTTDENLRALRSRDLIYRRQESAFTDTAEYIFRHSILREVTYECVLKRARKNYHGLVAEWLIQHSRERANEYIGLIADHFLHADNWEKSWTYHIQAAKKAQERFANQEAIAFLQTAMEISEHLPQLEVADLAEVHIMMADVLTNLNQYEQAIEELTRGLSIVSAEESSVAKRVLMAQIDQKIGRAFRSLGNYPQSIEVIEHGIARLPQDYSKEMGALQVCMASTLTRQGDLESAQQWCQEGIDNVEIGGDLAELAHAYSLLGTIRRDLGDTTASLDCRLKSLKISKDIANIALQMEAHNNLAVAYYDLGQLAEAAEHYEQSLELSERIGNLNTSARAEINLGEVHLIRGDWDEAERAFYHALTIWEHTGYRLGQAYGCSNIGAVLTRKGMAEQALDYLERSLAVFIDIGAQSFLPVVYRRQASAHLQLGDLDRAEELIQNSLNLSRQLSMPQEEGAALRTLGGIYYDKGQLIQAEECLNSSLKIFHQAGVQYEEARVIYMLTRLWYDNSQYERVVPALNRTIECFRSLGAQVDLIRAQALKNKLPLQSSNV